ncbi:RNA polymerase sigma factor [Paenibacillus thalictri]|uniref:RNA polymerase sigma factor n=1 Tax=Paenibacillus thalictri TaxID=2527873 RepID=UPI0013EF3B4E|nr:RNA polymerase sigma factor [Paenibacillus thalictri]
MEYNERELIDKVRQGDLASFEPIIRTYQNRLFSFCCYMLGDRQEAEDAVQEIYVKAYRGLAAYRHEFFMAWLYKIAANHCRTVLGRRKRWLNLLPLLRAESREHNTEHTYAGGMEAAMQLLDGLSAADKEILILRVVEDQPFENISRILEITSAAARKRFERVKTKLKKKLSEGGGSLYGTRCEVE